MEVDIRKIRCGGWDSSHINVKVNGRWRYLYQPNNLKPLNVREPIDFTGGYKPPLPTPSIAKLIQSQKLVNYNGTLINIPIAGSTLRGSKVDSYHPAKKRFLMTSAINRPKAPYSFYPKGKRLNLNQNNETLKSLSQDNAINDESYLDQDSNVNSSSQSAKQNFTSSICPPAMSNENFQRFHEQSQRKVRLRRKSYSSYLDRKANTQELNDNFSNLSNLTMTQTSYYQNTLSKTEPNPIISSTDDGNEEDSLYFLTAAPPQNAFKSASSRPQNLLNTPKLNIKKPREKRNPSIDGHTKPLMKFKCMVRPQVDSGFRGDTSKLEGIEIESSLPENVKNYFIEAKERQKQLQQEYQDFQHYQSYTY